MTPGQEVRKRVETAFGRMFGFIPTGSKGLIGYTQRSLERTIVANELADMLYTIGRYRLALRQREAPAWLMLQRSWGIEPHARIACAVAKLVKAERFASVFGLHPNQKPSE